MSSDEPKRAGFFGWATFGYANTDLDEPVWYVGCASVPPKFPGDKIICNGDFDDHIKDIGDRIVSLSPSEANNLNRYLKTKGVDK